MPHGLLQVRAAVRHAPHELTLEVSVLQGPPVQLMVTHQVALGGDEGSVGAPLHPIAAQPLEGGVWVGVPAGSELAARFPEGRLCHPAAGRHGVRTDRRRRVSASGRPRAGPALGLRHRHGRPTIRPAHPGPLARCGCARGLVRPVAALGRTRPGRCSGGGAAVGRDRALVPPQRAGALPGAARAGAVFRRRLGHTRCLPGPAGNAAGAGPPRAGPRPAAACLCRAGSRWRLAAVVHVLRARPPHPRGRFTRRHRLLAAAGPGALPAGHRRPGFAAGAAAVLTRPMRRRPKWPACGSTCSVRWR
jgi:hypothetical protein